ncbi:MAG: hypothetical protein AAF636_07645 [Pseudomonadota bacterium]
MPRPALPRVVRLYMVSATCGFVASGAFFALILAFNVVNLLHLIFTSNVGGIAAVAFWVLSGLVFSGVQFGYSVMRMDEYD